MKYKMPKQKVSAIYPVHASNNKRICTFPLTLLLRIRLVLNTFKE